MRYNRAKGSRPTRLRVVRVRVTPTDDITVTRDDDELIPGDWFRAHPIPSPAGDYLYYASDPGRGRINSADYWGPFVTRGQCADHAAHIESLFN
jgi:hypothetical protein